MNKLEYYIKENATAKQRVQDLGVLLRGGKAKRFIDIVDQMNLNANVHSYGWTGGGQLTLYVVVSDLDGFKDPRLEGAINAFEYLNPVKTTTGDNAGSFERSTSMYWTFLPNVAQIGVTVVGRIKETSETCKRIVTEVVHQEPIYKYKFVCDDELSQENISTFPEAPKMYEVAQIADVSADLDELTRVKAVAEPTPIEPAPDLGDWSTK